jgi:PAT family beta-lactamase induction signal transducer AmpG
MVTVAKRIHKALAPYMAGQVLIFIIFGFASGLPLAVIGETFRFWLVDEGVSLGTIGLTSLIGTAYTLKFLWAPIVDRISLGRITKKLGQRRSWLMVTQILLAILIISMSGLSPATQLTSLIILAVVVAFISATFDIAVDAFRIEILSEEQLAAGTAVHVYGWYLGAKLVGGALALVLADMVGWSTGYFILGLLMGLGVIAVMITREPERKVSAEMQQRAAEVGEFLKARPKLPKSMGRAVGFVYVAAVAPFLNMWERFGRTLIPLIAFIVLFKLCDAFGGVMSGPFLRDIGFTNTTIAEVYKVFGLVASLVGLALGGLLVSGFGLMTAVWVAGILQVISNLGFSFLSTIGPDAYWLAGVIGFENLSSGMGNTILVVFLSKLCSTSYTATQFALLSAFALLARTYLASPAGFLAEHIGWFDFFIVSAAAGIPSLLLLWWFSKNGGLDVKA